MGDNRKVVVVNSKAVEHLLTHLRDKKTPTPQVIKSIVTTSMTSSTRNHLLLELAHIEMESSMIRQKTSVVTCLLSVCILRKPAYEVGSGNAINVQPCHRNQHQHYHQSSSSSSSSSNLATFPIMYTSLLLVPLQTLFNLPSQIQLLQPGEHSIVHLTSYSRPTPLLSSTTHIAHHDLSPACRVGYHHNKSQDLGRGRDCPLAKQAPDSHDTY